MFLSEESRGGERGGADGSGREARTSVVPNDGFQLMYVRRLLREVGNGTIPEILFEYNYGQLVGYLRACLEQ